MTATSTTEAPMLSRYAIGSRAPVTISRTDHIPSKALVYSVLPAAMEFAGHSAEPLTVRQFVVAAAAWVADGNLAPRVPREAIAPLTNDPLAMGTLAYVCTGSSEFGNAVAQAVHARNVLENDYGTDHTPPNPPGDSAALLNWSIRDTGEPVDLAVKNVAQASNAWASARVGAFAPHAATSARPVGAMTW